MDNDKSTLEPSQIVETLEGDERTEWLKTGELPGDKPPAEKVEEAKPVAVEEEPKFAQPKVDKPPRKANQMGYAELRAENARLKAEIEAKKPEPKVEAAPAPAVAKPAERAKPSLADKNEKGESKYTTYEDYMEDLADWKAEQKLAAFETKQAEKAKTDAEKVKNESQQQEISKIWGSQVDAVRAKHADYDKVALATDLPIPPGSAVEQWILQLSREGSPVGAEMLYHLGNNREELKSLNAMHPVEAARHLAALEAELTGEEPPPEKAPEPKKQEPKRVSGAPPPVPEIGNNQAAGYDPALSALKDGDFEAYRKAQNAKERQARKG